MEPGAHQALCRAAVEIIGDSEVQSDAPQTSAKWTEFRQRACSYLQLRGGRQTLHGAAGFWASSELPIVVWALLYMFVLIKLFL